MIDFDQIISESMAILSAIDPRSMALFISWMGMLFCLGGMVIIIRRLIILKKLYESRLSKISYLIVALTKAMDSREKSFDKSVKDFVKSVAQMQESGEDISQAVICLTATLKRLEESGVIG